MGYSGLLSSKPLRSCGKLNLFVDDFCIKHGDVLVRKWLVPSGNLT